MSHLADILEHKRAEVTALRRTKRVGPHRTPLNAVRALGRDRGAPLRLIAEVKLRSPSAGALSSALAPGERALAYAESGAAMVSVLCDTRFFDGSWAHLAAVRDALDQAGRPVAVLAKEFVLDPRQIEEARDRGADAVLLIARIVDRSGLAQLVRAARAEGLEPLVEVVDEQELEAALAAEARIVGVNARDLDTLVLDEARAARVCAAVPAGVVAVYLSGLRTREDVVRIARGRAEAALVGEIFMRTDDPRPLVRSFVAAAGGAGK